jgi:hypothetical protein
LFLKKCGKCSKKCEKKVRGYLIRDTRCRIADSGYKMQDRRYRIQDGRYRILDAG